MAEELGKISIYLAKDGNTFDSVLQNEHIVEESDEFKIRTFESDGAICKFYCLQTTTAKPSPPWLDFINEKIDTPEDKLSFDSFNRRPSGLLLIEIEDQIFAASFGASGRKLLDSRKFRSDFGIKTAMNMCGNTELRQTKSRTHAITTQQIDRQLSRPSDAFDFGMGETELLKYISAQLENDKKVTLQGKDSLTIKVIGDEKLSWERLIGYCSTFLAEYQKDRYKTLFPNYPNVQEVSAEKSNELDAILIEQIRNEDFSLIHLAIPEFIADDEYSFSYTNYSKRENIIISHLDTAHLKAMGVLDLGKLDIKKLKARSVFAFSHDEDRILEYKKWYLYDCIVAEIDDNGEYFVLSEGEWRKIDDDFYTAINDFIENDLTQTDIDNRFRNINIAVQEKKQNREEAFNTAYVALNDNAILFDKAKLRIGQSQKDKEFCDILELNPGNATSIIHVKKYGGSSAINYLFSQARFYCDFFLRDETFLSDIRDYIDNSNHPKKADFLEHIKENLADVSGNDYEVKLWVLYDSGSAKIPNKADLPIMAKYELKLTYDRLRNVNKYSAVSISMIPVVQVNFKTGKKAA